MTASMLCFDGCTLRAFDHHWESIHDQSHDNLCQGKSRSPDDTSTINQSTSPCFSSAMRFPSPSQPCRLTRNRHHHPLPYLTSPPPTLTASGITSTSAQFRGHSYCPPPFNQNSCTAPYHQSHATTPSDQSEPSPKAPPPHRRKTA